jgi:hypothetical protein
MVESTYAEGSPPATRRQRYPYGVYRRVVGVSPQED